MDKKTHFLTSEPYTMAMRSNKVWGCAGAHVVMLGTYVDVGKATQYAADSPQLKWLRAGRGAAEQMHNTPALAFDGSIIGHLDLILLLALPP